MTDGLDRPPVGRLTPAHVTSLAAVARRPRDFAEPVKAYRAIQALAEGAPVEVSVPVLSEILGDRTADVTDRVTAARALGLIAKADSEGVLLRAGREEASRVRQAGFAALGMFAGPESLRELPHPTDERDPAASRQLALTRALVSHRHGLDGPYLPASSCSSGPHNPVGERAEVTLRTKSPSATRADRRRFIGSAYGIELADRALQLKCGRAETTIFLNLELGPSLGVWPKIFERPWVAGLMGRWFVEGRSLTTQHLILTRPVGRLVRIDIVRTDGRVTYAGRAEPSDSGLTFSISSTDRPGVAPTYGTGRAAPGVVELDVVIALERRVGVGVTDAVGRPR